MTQQEKARALQKTEKAKCWLHLCGRSDFQSLDRINENTYICSLHFAGGKGPTEEDEDPLLSTPVVRRIQRGKRKATRGTSVKDEKSRCLKRKNNEDFSVKKKVVLGKRFDLQDLQWQHVQLLKAFTELQTEANKLRVENEKLEAALHGDFSKLSYRVLRCDSTRLLFLTGLHAAAFDWLLPKVSCVIFRVHPEVTPQDHLLILLMKLKLGLCDHDLGYRFQIDGGIITAMCQTWIPALAAVLSPLVEWPSADAVVKTRPGVFRGKVRRCRCIVDALEVTVATPNASTKVVSYLIGATPGGAVSFVSPGLVCRKKSNKQLMKESGFMEVLKPMDLLLTNKKFPVQKELDAIGASLITPDSAEGKGSGVTKALDFPVAVWSHVEKVMGWWKDFGVFQTAVSADYEEMLDDIVVICAALTNLRISLVPVKHTQKCKT